MEGKPRKKYGREEVQVGDYDRKIPSNNNHVAVIAP